MDGAGAVARDAGLHGDVLTGTSTTWSSGSAGPLPVVPLDLTIAGGGAFPNPARAKVLFAGVDADGARTCASWPRRAAAATKAGADAEGGRFHPHVTLARIGRPVEATRWLRVLEGYRGPTWRATEVTLIAVPPRRGAAAPAALRGGRAFPLGRTP